MTHTFTENHTMTKRKKPDVFSPACYTIIPTKCTKLITVYLRYFHPGLYHTIYYTNHIYIAPICGATEALDDSQSGGIKQKCFQMFLKNRVWVAQWNIWGKATPS